MKPFASRLRQGCLAAGLWATVLSAKAVILHGGDGIAVTVSKADHRVIVAYKPADWKFAGDFDGAGDLIQTNGSDAVGPFNELRLRDGDFTRAIRVYPGRPLVLFGITAERAVTGGLPEFPRFTEMPGLSPFSYREEIFAPPSFQPEQNATPWLLFNARDQAVIFSPANNFFLARMDGDGTNLLACGLNAGATNLPAGFTQRTLVAFGGGINATWDAWGRALTDLHGKTRPANDADIGLRYLGCWTDNGAHYYYNYDTNLGYAGTLAELVQHDRDSGIPIRYLQLDSWWYHKSFTGPDGRTEIKVKNPRLPEGEWNRYGGLLKYEADAAVFPEGLGGFQKQVNLPFITHDRWVDPASPYRDKYKVSGTAAVDRGYWDELMENICRAGTVCYEQDWLNCIYNYSPELHFVPGLGEAFSDGMAEAAQARGLSLQYCMALPRNFLQGAYYGNLTTIRASEDRFDRRRWTPFLYASRLASALGIWPWTDVFMSKERNNLLISTLSAGMVGTGDASGAEDKENLMLAARPDGVLVKPDVPLVPTDATYINEAADPQAPMVASTFTQHDARRTAYVFVYNRRDADWPASFQPADLGLTGDVWLYEPRAKAAKKISARTVWTVKLKPHEANYFIVAPVGPSKIVFFGDAGKFVSTGHKRIAAIEESRDSLTATVIFAAGEKGVRLFGYAKREPKLMAVEGQVSDLSFDPASGRFEFTAAPSAGVTEELPGKDHVQQARIQIAAR
jgi:hypothetical protein